MVDGGRIRSVAVTGKLPMAPPFRETGMLVPAPLSPRQASAVLDGEHAALRAPDGAVGGGPGPRVTMCR